MASKRRPGTVRFTATVTTTRAARAKKTEFGIPPTVPPVVCASRLVVIRGRPPDSARSAP